MSEPSKKRRRTTRQSKYVNNKFKFDLLLIIFKF